MKIDRKILWTIEAFGMALLVWCIAGVLLHMDSLDSVNVTLRVGGTEHRDKTLLGVGKDDEPPDYRLRVRVDEYWHDLGTYGNTWIGDGLVFHTSSSFPMHEISEIQLLDDDKLENDLLEQFPLEGLEHDGNTYHFEISERTDISSGFAWFLKTPIGIAILTGISLAFLFIIFSVWQDGGF